MKQDILIITKIILKQLQYEFELCKTFFYGQYKKKIIQINRTNFLSS